MTRNAALIAFALLISCGVAPAPAELVTRDVVYAHQGIELEGYLAYDEAKEGPRPGVLV
jgi:hypothetical protein